MSLCMAPETMTALLANGELLICRIKKPTHLCHGSMRERKRIETQVIVGAQSQHCCQSGGENSKVNVRSK